MHTITHIYAKETSSVSRYTYILRGRGSFAVATMSSGWKEEEKEKKKEQRDTRNCPSASALIEYLRGLFPCVADQRTPHYMHINVRM